VDLHAPERSGRRSGRNGLIHALERPPPTIHRAQASARGLIFDLETGRFSDALLGM
jgi:hypothetical protein